MSSRKENITLPLLIILGVVIIPVFFIWKADNLFTLTIKTFLATFFLLLLVRTVTDKGPRSGSREPPKRDL
ncbi:MAG: hypothetical protein P8075_18865 [Deltaproteobacteria bacterium]